MAEESSYDQMASQKKKGSINLILSMMKGGKTSQLLHILETISWAEKPLYINHTFDNRSELTFSTHNLTLNTEFLSSELNADMIKVAHLSDIPDDFIRKYGVVCIDEIQFFSDLPEVVLKWSEEFGIDIHAAGLNGDFNRKNFGRVHELLPLADDVKFLRDTLCCFCALKGKRKTALFTKRLNDTTGGAQIQVGDSDYAAVCRECYSK